MKMKNTTVCATFLRSWLVESSGRIKSTDAPVVPMREARTEPTARKAVFVRGVASRSPVARMPPETTNRLPRSTMNDR